MKTKTKKVPAWRRKAEALHRKVVAHMPEDIPPRHELAFWRQLFRLLFMATRLDMAWACRWRPKDFYGQIIERKLTEQLLRAAESAGTWTYRPLRARHIDRWPCWADRHSPSKDGAADKAGRKLRDMAAAAAERQGGEFRLPTLYSIYLARLWKALVSGNTDPRDRAAWNAALAGAPARHSIRRRSGSRAAPDIVWQLVNGLHEEDDGDEAVAARPGEMWAAAEATFGERRGL